MAESTPEDKTRDVSDPQSDSYDPNSPHYDVTADSSSDFYVGDISDDATSGDDLRGEAEEQGDTFPMNFIGALVGEDKVNQLLYQDKLDDAKKGLTEDVELRKAGEAPKTVWDNASHEQMIETLNSKADSAAVGETSEEWVSTGNELTLHQKAVADAINDSMGDWKGDGGDAAREHLAGVAKWLGGTAQGSVLTGRQQQIHSQTLNETQKQMEANQPVPFSASEANARLAQIKDPIVLAVATQQELQTMEKSESARKDAARIMNQFDGTVGGATDMPLFAPPPKLATATAMKRAGGGGAGGGGDAKKLRSISTDQSLGDGLNGPGGGDGAGGGPGGNGATPFKNPQEVGANAFNPPNGPGGGPGGGGPGGGGYNPQQPNIPEVPGGGGPGGGGYNPQQPNIPEVPGGGGPGGGGYNPQQPNIPNIPNSPYGGPGPEQPGGPSYTPPKFDNPGFDDDTNTSSYTPPKIDTPDIKSGPNTPGWNGGTNGDISSKLGGGGGGLGSSFGGGGAGGGGLPGGPLGGGAGGGGAAGGGAGGLGSRTGGSVTGAGGFGPGGSGQGPGAAAGAAGASGRSGMMGGAPMGGAGGKKGEDDKEHRVAGYLADDENVFAAEQAIAPPVIGDWQNNKEEDWK